METVIMTGKTKSLLLGFVSGAMLSGIVVVWMMFGFINNWYMQGKNEGGLSAKFEILHKIESSFGTASYKDADGWLFHLKDGGVLVVKVNGIKTVKVQKY